MQRNLREGRRSSSLLGLFSERIAHVYIMLSGSNPAVFVIVTPPISLRTQHRLRMALQAGELLNCELYTVYPSIQVQQIG